MDELTIEKGVGANKRRLVTGQCCILSGLFAFTASIAIAAMTLSAIVYIQLHDTKAMLHQHRGERVNAIHVVQPDPEQDLAILKELEAMFERENLMHFNHLSRSRQLQARSSSQLSGEEMLNAGCNSTFNMNEKPLAHVVAGDKMSIAIPDERKPHSIITKGWVCTRPDKTQTSSTYGRVRGGMFFNRSSGFLRLPRTGVYYVYSLVHFRGSSRDSEQDKLIQSKMVACIPDLECEFPEDNYVSYLHSERRLFNATRYDEENNFQGGLFHFAEGTQLAIVVNNPKFSQTLDERNHRRDVIYLDGRRQHTYMGAFLVDDN